MPRNQDGRWAEQTCGSGWREGTRPVKLNATHPTPGLGPSGQDPALHTQVARACVCGSPAAVLPPRPPCALRWPRACCELGALSWGHCRPGRGSEEGDGREKSASTTQVPVYSHRLSNHHRSYSHSQGPQASQSLYWGLWCCLAGHPEDKLGIPQT